MAKIAASLGIVSLAFFAVLFAHFLNLRSVDSTSYAVGPGKCIVALSAGRKTLARAGGSAEKGVRKSLSKSIRKATGHKVVLLESGGRREDLTAAVYAAKQRADVVINVIHPSGSPDGFVSATARVVNTGKLLGDTAVPREDSEMIRKELTAWYAGLANRFSECPAFSLIEFGERLKKLKRCHLVLNLLEDFDYRNDKERKLGDSLYHQCRRNLVVKESRRTSSPLSHLLRLRMEGVRRGLQPFFEDAAQSSGIDRQVQNTTRQFADLVVTCANECEYGRIQLRVQFDQEWYNAHLKNKKNLLSPYRSLAGKLIDYRNTAAGNARNKAIRRYSMEMILVDVAGQELKMKVSGSSKNPKLATDDSPESFLQANP